MKNSIIGTRSKFSTVFPYRKVDWNNRYHFGNYESSWEKWGKSLTNERLMSVNILYYEIQSFWKIKLNEWKRAKKTKIWFLMVNYGAKNQRKLKAWFFYVIKKLKKSDAPIGWLDYLRKQDLLLKSHFTSTALYKASEETDASSIGFGTTNLFWSRHYLKNFENLSKFSFYVIFYKSFDYSDAKNNWIK